MRIGVSGVEIQGAWLDVKRLVSNAHGSATQLDRLPIIVLHQLINAQSAESASPRATNAPTDRRSALRKIWPSEFRMGPHYRETGFRGRYCTNDPLSTESDSTVESGPASC
jgi:hypothetical protein